VYLSEYSLAYKIRQYMHGLLLLAIAGVVIAMLENIVTSIPDQRLEIGKESNIEGNIIVIPDREEIADTVIAIQPRTSRTATMFFSEYAVFLRDPPIGYKYVIVFRFVSTINHVNVVNFDYNQYWRYELQVYNNYVFIEWADSIAFIEIYTNNQAYTDPVYIFVARADADISLLLDFSRAVQWPRFPDIRESFKNNTVIVLTPDVMWHKDYLTHTYYNIPRLGNPPSKHRYVIVFKNEDYIEEVYIRHCTGYTMYYYWELWDYVHGDYVYLPWNSCIIDFFIYAYIYPYAYNVYIFVVSENTRVPFRFSESEVINAIIAMRQQREDKGTGCAGFSISSRMLLRFVSWTATIALVVSALRKFDIML
jgi:hypothetical protein